MEIGSAPSLSHVCIFGTAGLRGSLFLKTPSWRTDWLGKRHFCRHFSRKPETSPDWISQRLDPVFDPVDLGPLRRQLAENAWLVSLGCSGGPQRACGDYLHLIQLGFQGKPILRKIGRFSLYACGNGGGSAPCGQARLWRPNGPQCAKSHAVWQSPSSRTEKLRTSQKYFFCFSTLFRAHWGAFRGLRTVGHITQLAYYLMVPAAPGRLNAAWAPGKTHTSERSVLYGTYGHIHRYRGHIQ